MLPPALSNDVCSLNPGVDRFAMSVYMTLTPDGGVQGRHYERTALDWLANMDREDLADGREGAPA